MSISGSIDDSLRLLRFNEQKPECSSLAVAACFARNSRPIALLLRDLLGDKRY